MNPFKKTINVVILDIYPVRSKASEPRVWYNAMWKKFLCKKVIASVTSSAYRVDVKLACHVNINFKFIGEFPWRLIPTDIF